MALVLADTNLWLRVADATSAHHVSAQAALDKLERAGHDICVTPQVFIEYWAVGTRPVTANGLGWSAHKVDAEIDVLTAKFALLLDTSRIFTHWRFLMKHSPIHGKRTHDARLAAVMLSYNVAHILTFNGSDFRSFPHVTVLDPNDVASGAVMP